MNHAPRNPLDQIISICTFAMLVATILLVTTMVGHCTTKENRRNSLGVSETYSNPYEYMFGDAINLSVFEEKGKYFTNVTFKPFGSTMIYTENLLFCGNEQDSFGDNRARIVTYRRVAQRMYTGIACHDIYRVIEIDVDEGGQ